MEILAGEKAFNATGSWLPDETMQAFKDYLVGIKGPLTTPIGGGYPFFERGFKTRTRFICLSSSGSLVPWSCFSDKRATESKYAYFP